MHTTPKGKISTKHPTLNMTWKKWARIQKVAELSALGIYSNEQIANHMGVHVQTVVLLRQTSEYHRAMLEHATGIVSQASLDVRTDAVNIREEVRSLLPSALNVIRDTILQTKNPGLRLKAAESLLDREGTLAKVSKTSVSVDTAPDQTVDPEVRDNILNLLSGTPSIGATNLTMTEILTGGFTTTAAQATKTQIDLNTTNTKKSLEQLDALVADDPKKIN